MNPGTGVTVLACLRRLIENLRQSLEKGVVSNYRQEGGTMPANKSLVSTLASGLRQLGLHSRVALQKEYSETGSAISGLALRSIILRSLSQGQLQTQSHKIDRQQRHAFMQWRCSVLRACFKPDWPQAHYTYIEAHTQGGNH